MDRYSSAIRGPTARPHVPTRTPHVTSTSRAAYITSQSQHWQTQQPSNMSNFLRNGRKIIAIGRNYVDHAKELGNAVPKG